MTTAAPPRESVLAAPYRALTFGIVLSVGVVAFQAMGVVTVLPVIARDIGGLQLYGWGLSSLMLANIIGTVVAGRIADRRGPAGPFIVAVILFLSGAVVAGIAPVWLVFLAGQAIAGLGVGAVMALAYLTVGRAYPSSVQPRMIAVLSSAWLVPSLIGPAIAGLIAGAWTWRLVFALFIILAAVAAVLTLPGLRGLERVERKNSTTDWSPLISAVVLSGGTAVLLVSFTLRPAWLVALVAVIGAAIAIPALRRVIPAGTLSMRRGVPAGTAMRFLIAGAFFGADTFLPLGLTEYRHLTATQAGLAISAGALTWVLGSALQAKMDARGWRRAPVTAYGALTLLAGIGLIMATVLMDALPALLAVAGWAIGGLGMGLAFNAATTEVVEHTPDERQGEIGASLQLAQTLSVALVSGLGGAAIALAPELGGTALTGIAVAFGLAVVGAVVALLSAGRITVVKLPTG